MLKKIKLLSDKTKKKFTFLKFPFMPLVPWPMDKIFTLISGHKKFKWMHRFFSAYILFIQTLHVNKIIHKTILTTSTNSMKL